MCFCARRAGVYLQVSLSEGASKLGRFKAGGNYLPLQQMTCKDSLSNTADGVVTLTRSEH